MGFQLEDGGGSGSLATVESNSKRLRVDSRASSRAFYRSRDSQDTYTWASGTYDYDAADTILLIKNTSTTKSLYICRVWLSGGTDTRVVIHVPTTIVTTPAGTAITGRNLDTRSGKTADATAIRDETANSQGDIYWSGEIQAASDPFVVDFQDALILGTNESIGVDYVTDGAACDVTIIGFYDDTTSTS